MYKISIICALGKNRAIGRRGELLWSIPEDMQRFRELTTGHTVIMGRKTLESIGKPLLNRINIIVTRQKDYKVKNCFIVDSLKKAIELAKKKEKEELFIIGGGEIYKQALPLADKLYLTVVDDGPANADTFFPEYSEFSKVVYKKESGNQEYKYTFFELVRE